MSRHYFHIISFCIILLFSSYTAKNIKACKLSLTKTQVKSSAFYGKCVAYNFNRDVEHFKIKFKGNPTIRIKGSTLNEKALALVKQLKVNDIFHIFDIQLKDTIKKVKPIVVTIRPSKE